MTILDILLIIIILDIAGILHILTIKKDFLHTLAFPFSQKLFGKNKTWRGLFIMAFVSGIIGYYIFGFFFSFGLGAIWILGELPNSYMKRKLGIAPGQQVKGIYSLIQYIVDTLDSIIALIIFLEMSVGLSFFVCMFALLAGFLNHAILDILSYRAGIKTLNYPNPLIIFFQIFVWMVFRPVHYCIGKRSMISVKIGKNDKNIFIANHISKLDPFLICTAIDFSSTKQLIPYRFMVSESYTKRPIYNFLLKLVGGYGAYVYNAEGRNQSLALSQKFLDRGETVVIFPEGGIHKKKFGVGAFYLNKNTIHSRLHLFRIEKIHKRYTIDYRGTETLRENLPEADLYEQGQILFHKITEHANTSL